MMSQSTLSAAMRTKWMVQAPIHATDFVSQCSYLESINLSTVSRSADESGGTEKAAPRKLTLRMHPVSIEIG